MPPPLASVAGPVRRFVVDAYHHIDTGGPEALVQLALSLSSLCPNSTYLSLRPINPRLAAEYPGLRRLPMVRNDRLRRGDVYIIPETVSCDEALGRRGIRSFVYMLSAKARRRNWQSLRKGCRLLSHNFWGADHTSAGLSLPRGMVIRPYISPSIKARCDVWSPAWQQTMLGVGAAASGAAAATTTARFGSGSRPDLVLIDHDVPAEVEAAARAACAAHGCECVRVGGDRRGPKEEAAVTFSRAQVAQLLARAKLVVDWCLVGSERLAIEAVLCGASLLTSACKAGAEPRDFPLPRSALLASPANLSEAIPRALRQHGSVEQRRGYEPLVRLYAGLDAASMRAETVRFLGATGLTCGR